MTKVASVHSGKKVTIELFVWVFLRSDAYFTGYSPIGELAMQAFVFYLYFSICYRIMDFLLGTFCRVCV